MCPNHIGKGDGFNFYSVKFHYFSWGRTLHQILGTYSNFIFKVENTNYR